MKYSKILLCCIITLLTFGQHALAQPSNYTYKREIKGITEQWERVILPDDIYEKLNDDLSDIRIYGTTVNNDTTEVPYRLNPATRKTELANYSLSVYNRTYADGYYYFTMSNPAQIPINEIYLSFKQKNFDWQVTLQGRGSIIPPANPENEDPKWYTILDNYRIVSIENDLTDYQFTTLKFPDITYATLRLSIKSESEPELISATTLLKPEQPAVYKNYPVSSFKIEDDKQKKQSIIRVNLPHRVPVCSLRIYVKDTMDFYRPVILKYIADSTKTEKGWHYNYRTITQNTLNSVEKNNIVFDNIMLSHFMFVVDNGDNKPLTIDSVAVSGNICELTGRFDDRSAAYFLYYGNKQASKPNYDIDYFQQKTLIDSVRTTLGDEIVLKQTTEPDEKETSPFENEIVLWSLIGLIILTLGWFSLKMIKKK